MTTAAEGNLATAKAAFMLGLRARGIRNLDVLRAMEMVPREIFVPHSYADLAARDLALPIACGQTMPEPFLVARMMEALELTKAHRVLEIGSGSGYASAILAKLAGEVLSIERFQSLAIAARARLEALQLDNAAVVWGDGLRVPVEAGPFDRVIIHGIVEGLPESFDHALAGDGRIILARRVEGEPRQNLVSLSRDGQGGWLETPLCTCRLQALLPGMSQGL